MSNPYLGEIGIVGFNFAPYGWALRQGRTLSIAQYSAMFALLGTQFGGNGTRRASAGLERVGRICLATKAISPVPAGFWTGRGGKMRGAASVALEAGRGLRGC
ncbi:MAG: phage tail protein, partial [Terracidiphilus sp.]